MNPGFKLCVCVCVCIFFQSHVCHVLVFCWLMAVVCFLPCFPPSFSFICMPFLPFRTSLRFCGRHRTCSSRFVSLFPLFVSLICGFDLCCPAVGVCAPEFLPRGSPRFLFAVPFFGMGGAKHPINYVIVLYLFIETLRRHHHVAVSLLLGGCGSLDLLIHPSKSRL